MNEICECCEGVQKITPVVIANRPGLNALIYRVGTHAGFFETMKARLSNFGLDIPSVGGQSTRIYPLQGLTTRAPNDPAIALLDAWATVAGVLTFYQERIANEGYLRTAVERRSILELARLIGYTLRPGVAASAYLAYTLDPSSTGPVEIPAGSRAQSLPGPGEMPQSFETSEKLVAQTEWNTLKPRLTRPQTEQTIRQNQSVYLQGTATNLKPNDMLLIQFEAGSVPEAFRVMDVQPDTTAGRTLVSLQAWQPAAQKTSVLTAVSDLIKHYSAVENFGVSRNAEMTKRALAQLNQLQSRLAEGASSGDIATLVEHETLPRLAEEQQVAEANPQYTKLAPWLRNLVADLSGASQKLSPNAPAFVSRAAIVPRKVDTLASLLKRPLPQPANSLQLARSVKSSFASRADTQVQLVNTFQPFLRVWLPTALANSTVTPTSPIHVFAMRVKSGTFGHNAPKKPTGLVNGVMQFGEWDINDMQAAEETTAIYLDASYDKIVPEGWVAVDTSAVDTTKTGQVQPDNPPLLIVQAGNPNSSISRAEYGLNGPTTRVELMDPADNSKLDPWIVFPSVPVITAVEGNPPQTDEFQMIRRTVVYAASEELTPAEEPIESSIGYDPTHSEQGNQIELDRLYDGLESGRWLIVSGERTDVQDSSGAVIAGIRASELVMLAGIVQTFNSDLPGDTTHSFLQLAGKGLAYAYKLDSVTIYANVVNATHGETRHEVLGSGDGSKSLQTFALRQLPLTYLSAPTPSGAVSTLQVSVNNIVWHEAGGLAGLTPTDRSYLTHTSDDGKTTVIFGDGQRGARPPTGVENIKAVYRTGIGKPGNVKAGQISLLATRPLGVKSVVNPLPASGGADPEGRDQARRNAPLAVMSLDRLVSVQDYADFPRTFAGIGKASAQRLSNGRRQLVHVTIAGADDIPIEETSDLYKNLLQALRKYGDPYQPIQLAMRELLLMIISARVHIEPDYEWEAVVTQIRAGLLDTFGFDRRDLGQDVLLSEVISAIQSVEGVAYVDVDALDALDQASVVANLPGSDAGQSNQPDLATRLGLKPQPRIPVALAQPDPAAPGGIHPAQLAYLTPDVPETLILNRI